METVPRANPAQERKAIMSTDFRLLNKVRACDLFDGRLEAFGVREEIAPDSATERARCLADGRNYLWAYIDDDGQVGCLTRYAPGGAPGKILNAIAEACDADIVSEYQPQFCGYDTQAEWDAAMEQMSKQDAENFHAELLKYLRGEPNEIRPGTNGMTWAEIAKRLVENEPELLLPENKEKLRGEIDAVYDRPHSLGHLLRRKILRRRRKGP
jgi:hypothetical protein